LPKAAGRPSASSGSSLIFTTYWFHVFAVVVVAAYWLLWRQGLRIWFLALACLVFHYHFAGPAGMAPIIVLMIVTYAAGRSARRWACNAAMALCVGTLCLYKYAVFLIGAVVGPLDQGLAGHLSRSAVSLLPALPPLGISFFAFEFVHYLFEVRRGGEPIRSPLKFLVFCIFFPSLVAGPIKRYPQFLASLDEGSRQFELGNIAGGVFRIAVGFFKKVVIADNLNFYLTTNYADFGSLGLGERWAFLAAISFRILMDFSGYSDIAIGAAKLLGVRLPENFNWPYFAGSIRDFWQKWHISLSSWIRDYIYIPLGGNRLGVGRRVLNGMIAFAVIGLWHGPAWNFVLWGLYHGVGLAVCSTYSAVPVAGPLLGKVLQKEPLIGWASTQLFVWLGWLLFFYPAPVAWNMARLLFGQ
jgi:alginate O-acetyltransferase complex protein AlgI